MIVTFLSMGSTDKYNIENPEIAKEFIDASNILWNLAEEIK